MFSRTVCAAKGCTIWKVRVMPARAFRCGARPVMSRPSKRTVPGVGRQEARHQREQRRLAGAVRADQRAERARRHARGSRPARRAGRRSAIDTPASASSGSATPPSAPEVAQASCQLPARPRGRNITISTSTMP